jgi:hypothetical protein
MKFSTTVRERQHGCMALSLLTKEVTILANNFIIDCFIFQNMSSQL